VRGYLAPGDLALLKGSRGMALERLSESLMASARPVGDIHVP
jgi:UDP-N-acetylmuramyl pentapeptide synthase